VSPARLLIGGGWPISWLPITTNWHSRQVIGEDLLLDPEFAVFNLSWSADSGQLSVGHCRLWRLAP